MEINLREIDQLKNDFGKQKAIDKVMEIKAAIEQQPDSFDRFTGLNMVAVTIEAIEKDEPLLNGSLSKS